MKVDVSTYPLFYYLKMSQTNLSLNNQFLRYEEELENKLFKPNELISLIILNYFQRRGPLLRRKTFRPSMRTSGLSGLGPAFSPFGGT